MCTAYELGKRGGSFPKAVTAVAAAQLLQVDLPIIRPTHEAPVIMPDGSLEMMKWGFRRQMKGASGRSVWRTIVNSREDKLSGMTWRNAFRERRCLVPASAFYEWVVVSGQNQPLRFESPADEWLWIAGIWEEGEEGKNYSMITTEPNAVVGPVHDRMPAVLHEDRIDTYLTGELNEFGPSSVMLQYQEAANFLKKKTVIISTDIQQELF